MINVFCEINAPTMNLKKMDGHEDCLLLEVKNVDDNVLSMHFANREAFLNFALGVHSSAEALKEIIENASRSVRDSSVSTNQDAAG